MNNILLGRKLKLISASTGMPLSLARGIYNYLKTKNGEVDYEKINDLLDKKDTYYGNETLAEFYSNHVADYILYWKNFSFLNKNCSYNYYNVPRKWFLPLFGLEKTTRNEHRMFITTIVIQSFKDFSSIF